MNPLGGSASDDSAILEMSPSAAASRQSSNSSSSSEEDSVDGKQTEEPLKELASHNHYELRKNAVHAVMNFPLIAANTSQIRSLISSEREENSFFSFVLGLIITSLALQCLFFFVCIAIYVRERLVEKKRALKSLKSKSSVRFIDGPRESSSSLPSAGVALTSPVLQVEADVDWCLDILNYISLFIVFAITIINMMILGFTDIPQQNSMGFFNTTHVYPTPES